MNSDSEDPRRGRAWRLLGLATFGISFFTQFSYILNHFYINGAFLLDSGVFAHMMWRATPLCLTPLQDHHVLNGGSYYQVHLTLLAGLFSVISSLVPVNHIVWFALYQGLSFGLLAYSIFYIGQAFYRSDRLFAPWLWCLLGTAFAHSGLALAMANYPHHELAASGLQILFFALLLQKRIALASLCFGLALLVREDVGFHLCAILGLLTVYRWLRGEPWKGYRIQAIFMLLAFLASLAAILLQKLAFPGGIVFSHTYLGDADTRGWPRIWGNLQLLLECRHYLWMPLLATLLFSLFRRDPVLLLAVLAYLPWALLNLHGTRPEPGTLFAYYAYPFLNSLAWILLSPQLGGAREGRPQRANLVAFALVIALSNWGLGRIEFDVFLRNITLTWRTTDAIRQLPVFWERLPLRSDNMLADSAVVSLAGPHLPVHTWICAEPEKAQLDRVLFWEGSMDLGYVQEALLRMGETRAYRLAHTRLGLAVKEGHLLPEAVRELLVPTSHLWATHRLLGGVPRPQGHYRLTSGPREHPFLLTAFRRPPAPRVVLRYGLFCHSLPEDQGWWIVRSRAGAGQAPQEVRLPLSPGECQIEVPLDFPDPQARNLEITHSLPAYCEVTALDYQVLLDGDEITSPRGIPAPH